MHKCEPNLAELKTIQRELFSAASTDENMKKINAIESQIKRHEAAKEAEKATGTTETTTEVE